MYDHKRLPVLKIVGAAAVLLLLAMYLSVQAPSSAAITRDAVGGELVYVPIYSSIYYENGAQTLELAATLSIHNVNPDRHITIARADYYDTTGKLIKRYLDKPLELGPLQTKHVVIEQANRGGGTGANFLVEWQAGQEAISPLVEALMVNASSNLGIAFPTTGTVIRSMPRPGSGS